MPEDTLHQLIKQAETFCFDDLLRLAAHLSKLIQQRETSEITHNLSSRRTLR